MNNENNRQTNENILALKDENVFNRKFQKSFNVLKKIGKGAFGEVFMGKERSNGDMVANQNTR